ncbi:MAG: arylsulfatase [Planctomycetales bacterium]|nr:arylsulfatase [Planctomycetales bacterium]
MPLVGCLCAVTLGVANSSRAADSARLPNIVFVLADDMGYGDPGCFNSGGKIRTPQLDRLAAAGMRFTDAHSPGAVCVPTRYGIITGRYPFRRPRMPWQRESVIDESRMTIGAMLQQAGYRTECVGKWHLGFNHTSPPDYSRMSGGPLDRGFNHYFGLPHSLDIEPYYYIEDRTAVAAPTERVAASSSDDWSPIQGEFWRAGGLAPGFRHDEVLPQLAERAKQAIARLAGESKPFFLYFALPAPHTPWLPLEPFRGSSAVGMYGDFVQQVDATVGDVLGQLERSGVAGETLVVFSSDNGPVWYPADTDKWKHAAAGPLRGMKGDAWEGGHRVPLIVRWPGHVAAGATSEQLVCQTDLFRTFAEICGVNLPSDAAPDSVSFASALRNEGKSTQPARTQLAMKSSRGFPVLRRQQWKLIVGAGSGGFSKSPTDGKGGANALQLYDLSRDLGEQNNLAEQRPQLAESMLAQWRELERESK